MSDRVFIRNQTCPNAKITGPYHICWDSCVTPGINCSACTNPEYYMCSKSPQCIHPTLRCNLSPDCDYGEDEEGCFLEYKTKGLVRPEATFQCGSIYYPQVTT